MRLLMRFQKSEDVKFISHLDMQRLFQRALRRAKLPCTYSQGFNPHLNISFACALPVGISSLCEYVEVSLEHFVAPQEAMRRLNEVLPKGVSVTAAVEPDDNYPNVGSVIILAEYAFTPETDADHSEIISSITLKESIEIEKKTKKGLATVNIRPMIHRLKQVDGAIMATLSCSNSENLRADTLKNILEEAGIKIEKAQRTKIFVLIDGSIREPLGEM